MSLHSSICIYRYCSYLQSKLLPSGSITAMMYLRHELLSPDLYGKKIEQAGQKLGGLSWHLSKKRAQTEMKQLHIVPKNNSSCKCHGGGGHFEPGCLKCIESAREESICPRCSKTWDYCLTFSCCYCRQALNNGSPNAYKTNVCHTCHRKSSPQTWATFCRCLLEIVNWVLHSNSADRSCVYVLPVWNKGLMSGRELHSCCSEAESVVPQIAKD